MRLLRHLSPSGPAYAALQPDGSARSIEGDVFGYFRATERHVRPTPPGKQPEQHHQAHSHDRGCGMLRRACIAIVVAVPLGASFFIR